MTFGILRGKLQDYGPFFLVQENIATIDKKNNYD
jgi:hypothetical protein